MRREYYRLDEKDDYFKNIPEWTEEALCTYLWEMFDKSYDTYAKRICSVCQVREKCLEDTVRMEREHGEDSITGIRAGYYPKERKKMYQMNTL